MSLGAADQAIIAQLLTAIAQEMGVKLVRSALSPILREARDGSAGLLDRDGHVVAQAELIPIMQGSLGETLRACLALYPPDSLTPDDILVNNSPFEGGQHLNDVFVFSPVFVRDRVEAFSATVAHHLDLGGLYDGTARDVFNEGMIIPPTRYSLSRDWNGGSFERLVRTNTRLPAQTIGDLNAQLAGNAIGAARFRALCDKYGVDTVQEAMREQLAYADRRMRAALAAVPDGVYRGTAQVDGIGTSAGDVPLPVHAALTIEGDRARVDFAGTHEQVDIGLNCPWASTVAATIGCLKSALTGTDIPYNAGVARSIAVTAPAGSLVNPRSPAPVRSRMQAAYRVFNAVMGALAQAVPDRAIAQGFDTTTVVGFVRTGPSGHERAAEVFGGGFGGSLHADGCDAIDSPLSNCANTPIEAFEMAHGFVRIEGYALAPDSFGHGRARGGAGFLRAYRVLEPGVRLTMLADRIRHAPEGLAGGGAGTVGRFVIRRGAQTIEITGRTSLVLEVGDRVEIWLGGGGGHGEASARPPALVARDVEDGLLSPESAASVYSWPKPT